MKPGRGAPKDKEERKLFLIFVPTKGYVYAEDDLENGRVKGQIAVDSNGRPYG